MSEPYCGRVIVMGPNRDGQCVCVDPRCPTCHRFVKTTSVARVAYDWEGNVYEFRGFHCPRCGPFQPEVVCWDGDLEGQS